MTDEAKLPPVEETPPAELADPTSATPTASGAPTTPTASTVPPPAAPPPPPQDTAHMPDSDEDAIGARINRLSGEPAPDISPDEFARLQRGGALNIDSRGRIRVNDDDPDDVGVSLRKRRAWYRA